MPELGGVLSRLKLWKTFPWQLAGRMCIQFSFLVFKSVAGLIFIDDHFRIWHSHGFILLMHASFLEIFKTTISCRVLTAYIPYMAMHSYTKVFIQLSSEGSFHSPAIQLPSEGSLHSPAIQLPSEGSLHSPTSTPQ